MQPGNPIVGGTVLRIPAIQSPNFVTGVSGWSINADGTAEFNGLIIHGSIIIGTGANNVIVLDFTRNAIFVYDMSARLIASIAPGTGTDSFGNTYQGGIVSYTAGNVADFSQLIGGDLQLSTDDIHEIQAFQALGSSGAGPGGDQPVVTLSSPTDNGTPTADTSHIEFFGANNGGSAVPFLRLRRAIASAMNVLIQGTITWSAPGSANYAETWHALPLATNWANQGAPFGNGSYRRLPDGIVKFTGAVKWTAAASNAPVQVCTALPADYRPSSQKRRVVMNMPADTVTPQIQSLDIHTDGTVWITSFPNGTGPVTPITLDAVSYPIDG